LRFVEKLVVATALTRFSFWRRYRAPKSSGEFLTVGAKGSG